MQTSTSSSETLPSFSDEEDHHYETNHTSPAASCSAISDDGLNAIVEGFRDCEYPQLKGRTYLDHGGTTIYAKSLIERFAQDMVSNLYGNPHSASTPSALAGHRIDTIRERALRFFNANPEDWDLVFVANATAAIKLVIESIHDDSARTKTATWYGYHRDAHTSLVGARELSRVSRCFTSDKEVDEWIDKHCPRGGRTTRIGLFAYPGQSNMTGRRLPCSWPGRIRMSGNTSKTYTLLDAAALASTAALNLSDPMQAPDFVALSFYKIFGFPNIGALLVQKRSQDVLQHRRYFGGGTVDMIISIGDRWHAKKDASAHDHLEDGTLPFHSIFALDHAISVHKQLYGPEPMSIISTHTASLIRLLYTRLCQLHHSNGLPVVRVYKDDNVVFGDPTVQGATIAMNVLRADGSLVGYADVEKEADQRSIFVRSGSLCNPGGVATYLRWSPSEMKAAFAAGHRCTDPTQVLMGKATGVVRVSLGAMSTEGDVQKFVDFVQETYLDNRCKLEILAEMRVKAVLPQPDSQRTMRAFRGAFRTAMTKAFSRRQQRLG